MAWFLRRKGYNNELLIYVLQLDQTSDIRNSRTSDCLGFFHRPFLRAIDCPLYTSDAADDLPCVDLGGRRIIKNTTYTPIAIPKHLSNPP